MIGALEGPVRPIVNVVDFTESDSSTSSAEPPDVRLEDVPSVS